MTTTKTLVETEGRFCTSIIVLVDLSNDMSVHVDTKRYTFMKEMK
jgi:hypothetical protein